ncbi:MAG: DUF1552 domain-containing protein [Planctomycetales bacterium]|nr:DUF1552 domain-containing protein [Planctomycetales bacterium]
MASKVSKAARAAVRPSSKLVLSRRSLIRGAGAALGLPWLEAMAAPLVASDAIEHSHASDKPVRMAALFVPNGVRQDLWTPQGEGKSFELSPALEPLRDVQKKLLVLTNLWNQGSDVGDGHYVKTSGFLTCTTINKSLGIDLNCNGKSVDQVAAETSGQFTPLASLELGIDPVTTGVDTNVGYTRVYGSHIAWAGPTRPLARELNPRLVFERIFRAANPLQQAARNERLLLDRVLDDAKQLRQQLGAADRQRVDEYLQSVRSIERRIEKQQDTSNPWQPLVELNEQQRPPSDQPDGFPEHLRLMMDMISLAFQTDTTRVCTLMYGNAVSGRNYSFLEGVPGGHHDTSHHQNEEEKLRAYQIITRWNVEQFAYLLGRLESMNEGDSTVLDNSMILYGSGLRDGNSHDPHNLPILLAGGGGGKINTGQHLKYSRDTPLSNLYTSMLRAFGSDTGNFADSTGTLPGVLV